MKSSRLLFLAAAAMAAAVSQAQNGVIELSSFPSISVSDGRTPVTITAQVRDSSGTLVPNGTQVLFESNLGSFRENVVTTENGYARATLIAPSVPGVARIRASSLRFAASNSIELEFVGDRTLLNTAKEFIEVTAPKSLLYSIAERTIEASGEERGVRLRYRDIEIEADDLQLMVTNYEVRARNATITIGKKTHHLNELYFKLNNRRGFGVAEFQVDGTRWTQSGPIILPYKVKRGRLGPVEVSSKGMTPVATPISAGSFKFRDLTGSLSSVEAKKAVAYPQKDIYFYRSTVKVSDTTVLKVPLFQVSARAANPLITDQFLNVTSTQLNVNYPYYLSLKPGETSLLRLRYGNRYGTGVGASSGLFLDYELKWNRGDEMDGGLNLYGLNRSDWGAGIRQSFQPDPRTSISAQIDFPAHRSMFGSFGVNRVFDGFQANFNAIHGRSIGSAVPFTQENYNLVVEKDPIAMGNFPAQLYLGVNASANKYTGELNRSQSGVGWQARMATKTLPLDRSNSINASFKVSQLSAQSNKGLSQIGSLAISSQFGPGLAFFTTYDYVQDGFSTDFLGRHRASTEAVLSSKNLTFRGFLSKSLDLNRLSTSLNTRWSVSGLWKVYHNYYFDRYLDGSFSDQSFILSYKLGIRELGLSYSQRTKRLGIEILGAGF